MDADQLVAKAYGITCDALSQWKKKLKHSNDPALLEIIESYKTNVVFPTNITKMQLKTKMLAEVARKGQIYRNARKSKKGKKTI